VFLGCYPFNFQVINNFFALKVSTNPEEFEEFHSVAGEIMFLPWLFIFLLIVTFVETKRLKRLEATKKDQTL